MTYHTYVVTNTLTQDAIVCCARSEKAAERMAQGFWELPSDKLISALRVAPGTFLEI